MDKTNRVVKVCRRLEELEYILSLEEGRPQAELDDLWEEQASLEEELNLLQPANHARV